MTCMLAATALLANAAAATAGAAEQRPRTIASLDAAADKALKKGRFDERRRLIGLLAELCDRGSMTVLAKEEAGSRNWTLKIAADPAHPDHDWAVRVSEPEDVKTARPCVPYDETTAPGGVDWMTFRKLDEGRGDLAKQRAHLEAAARAGHPDANWWFVNRMEPFIANRPVPTLSLSMLPYIERLIAVPGGRHYLDALDARAQLALQTDGVQGALPWFRKAAEAGSRRGRAGARIYPIDLAAAKGGPAAWVAAGDAWRGLRDGQILYGEPLFGSNHAFAWYKKAADAGDPLGQARVDGDYREASIRSAGNAEFQRREQAARDNRVAAAARLDAIEAANRPRSTLSDAAAAITAYAKRSETTSERDAREHRDRQDKADSEWERRQRVSNPR